MKPTYTYKYYKRDSEVKAGLISKDSCCERNFCVNLTDRVISFTNKEVLLCIKCYQELNRNGELYLGSNWSLQTESNISGVLLVNKIRVHNPKTLTL